ncbi:MAG: glycosyltransferase [Patescibacteria group bacterium]
MKNKKANKKTLTIVIPVYNEKQRIGKALHALEQGFIYPGIKLERIIFVNDGSTDRTVAIITRAAQKLKSILKAAIDIVSYSENQGKGYAIRTGLARATSDYVLFMDADMSTPLTEFRKFLPYIHEHIPVVIGTRRNGHSTVIKHQPLIREVLGRGFTLLSQVILQTWVSDFTCGFKLFSREAKDAILKRAYVNGWGYDAEFIFLARTEGFTIQQCPVLWSDDKRSKVHIVQAVLTTLHELLMIRFYHAKPITPQKTLALLLNSTK